MKKGNSYRRMAWQQLKKNKPAMIALYTLCFLALVALLAPLIANERPLYIHYKGEHLFPAFSFKSNYFITDPETGEEERVQLDLTDWKQLKADRKIWPPIAWSPGKSDRINGRYIAPSAPNEYVNTAGDTLKSPPGFRHYLGTGKYSDDVLSGLIHGTRISLTIGIFSMAIASFIGLALGAAAGYYKDNGARLRLGVLLMLIPGIFFGFFYGFIIREFALRDSLATSTLHFIVSFGWSMCIATVMVLLFYFPGKLLSRLPVLSRQVNIPVDSMISRLMEILTSLPKIILIIAVAAVASRSLINVLFIIGLTSWTGIARLTRAEMLRVSGLDYIQAARAAGLKSRRIIFRHALPNAMGPALISIAFGVASAILAESSLSFLGIGVPNDLVTWGSLLSAGKENYNAWWLVIFPGLAIFITVTAYNLIGDGLRDALDPKMKE